MRKASNALIWLAAAAICAAMTWLSVESGLQTLAFNGVCLAVMLVIILISVAVGFRRMKQTADGLNEASRKLIAVYKNEKDMASITRPGAQIFEVDYLDRKYQEYLGYLRKTNSPCDIGDYIGEYEINNYTHRRLVEMVPDILTSLGILGTFIGLVWGLQGFNPVSYEAMASSITSLIGGIKVAFVTSIYGISLSIAYSYTMRGALTSVSESLDSFLDKYYLCAVPPTDATAMNHVLANQREQTKALQGMSKEVTDQLAAAMAVHMDPVLGEINHTLQNFTDVVTLNQKDLMENVANSVMTSMRKEFVSEFAELRTLLKQTNLAEKQYLEYIQGSQEQFQKNLADGNKALQQAIAQASSADRVTSDSLQEQQEHLREFAEYMSQAMASMNALNQANVKASAAVTRQVETMEKIMRQTMDSAAAGKADADRADKAAERAEMPVRRTKIDDIDALTDRLDQVILLLEKSNRQQAQKQKKRGLFG